MKRFLTISTALLLAALVLAPNAAAQDVWKMPTTTDTVLDTLSAVSEAITVIDGLHDVPTANVATNAQMKDVIGNKNDAAVTAVDTTKSLIAYAKGIITLLGSLSLISDKEKSLLGIGAFPGFQDFFNLVADAAAPDTDLWAVLEAGGGTTTVVNNTAGEPGYLFLNNGANTGDKTLTYTQNKKVIGLKGGVTEIHLSSYARFIWTDTDGSQCAIGFIENDKTPTVADDLLEVSGAYEVASIGVWDQIPVAVTGTTDPEQQTDLSSWITTNVWFLMEIVITASDVKFYIDDVLRATHSTQVPSSVWQVAIAADNVTFVAATTSLQFLQVWGE